MNSHPSVLRDFTVDRRVWLLSFLALVIGSGAAVLAVALLRAISIATNLFYYHRFSMEHVRPSGSPLGHWMVLVPVVGGLIVGVMARYGSEQIRGHGIPEAIEAILLRRARVAPKVALLKPISAAISIGSGGPFGAEGPIIMTGGAFGSLIAQWIRLTDAERTTLLVAGAAAGMSATFSTPVAAILLAVELLLFEWRPRSLIPVAFASAAAGILRVYLLGPGPLFAMPRTEGTHTIGTGLIAVSLGAVVGMLAVGMSRMMYAFEDAFERLPIHWMWWPAIGGLGIGIGGLFFPRGLGVGYDNIAELLRGNASLGLIAGLLIAKSLMWAFSLGSGTSGGVLAPLLMIGGALGALAGHFAHAPVEAQALWALIGMGAMLSGSLGVPLTAILFSVEVTHCLPALLPLTLACVAAYLVTSLAMPRSILTERLSRRGYHLTREYGVDPLEIILIRDIMSGSIPEIESGWSSAMPRVFAYSDGTSRDAAEQMATSGVSILPIVDRGTEKICGSVTLQDLLLGRRNAVGREQERIRLAGGQQTSENA
ncbi:MAG: chloride channel protein [Acidobacteriaceae bacterium]